MSDDVRPGTARSAVVSLTLRDFRSYERAEVALGAGLTVVSGCNGAGKTNLLEGLYFGCVGRSCRTANDREVVRFGASLVRVEVRTRDRHGDAHLISVGFEPAVGKKLRVDGVGWSGCSMPPRVRSSASSCPTVSSSSRALLRFGALTSTRSSRRCGRRGRRRDASTRAPSRSATR